MLGFGFDEIDMFDIIFPIFFLIVAGGMVFIMVKAVSQWNKNRTAPVLTVPAMMISKREQRSRGNYYFYGTFKVNSGDVMVLTMDEQKYDMLPEGRQGEVTFKGNRMLEFKSAYAI